MSSTRLYKLAKSHEALELSLHEEFENLRRSTECSLIKAVESFAEISISVLLTYFLEKQGALADIQAWFSFVSVNSEIDKILSLLIPAGVTFFGILLLTKLLVFISNKLKECFYDEKKRQKDISNLISFFYQRILNNITVGISLEKKATELFNHKDHQDKILSNIYMHEALFYFDLASIEIEKRRLIETYNPHRKEYTEFLRRLNDDFLISMLSMIVDSIDRIGAQIKEERNIQDNIENLRRVYNVFISNISKQTGKTYDFQDDPSIGT